MSATRLLVLGVVRGFGRAHGYLVRAELLRWGAENWANIKWGSLYHALRKLAEEDLLIATEAGTPPGRVDYEITARGEAEFFRLLRLALREPAPRPDMLAAGLALLPALSRSEAIDLLRIRLRALESSRQEIPTGIPPHARELFGLWERTTDGDVAWTRQIISRLESGKYRMASEPGAVFGTAGAWPQVPA
ncbi:PadR family transcriptional regulator [Kibdelosporangium persicum]|uniref:Transcriptional regulator n=1 Tax=Kibdelosporangium persicum TaxID=2698649 RepID=A0ABX2F214_9PSEU|nr:PadR family transcriptional regulator [Kibdelosporangium persicum]NRN65350.1 Transcriptional regulator [Kibdelosporangium persicum]